MKILLAGSFQGWMGTHMRHVADAFRSEGHQIETFNYAERRTLLGLRIKPLEAKLLTHRLESMVSRCKPDLIYCIAAWPYDFERLRSYYSGLVVLHDYDGPRRNSVSDFLKAKGIDLMLTVSRYEQRLLQEQGMPCAYLPHGVNTEYYSPGPLPEQEQKLFSAPVSYIGRATPRRVALCEPLCKLGIRLYGDRWRKYPSCAANNPLHRNVQEKELVSIYRASTCVINLLQEPLDEYKTILSLQCFAVPASGACMIAERVEEYPDSFEEGKEILTFATQEELQEHVERMLHEPETARRIGETGRRRCLECHTHVHRVREFMNIIR